MGTKSDDLDQLLVMGFRMEIQHLGLNPRSNITKPM